MKRCRKPFLAVPALAVLLGLSGVCTSASAQDPERPSIFTGLAALSNDGMAGVSAKGADTGTSVRPGTAQPSLQLWDEVRPMAQGQLPGAGVVTVTVNTTH